MTGSPHSRGLPNDSHRVLQPRQHPKFDGLDSLPESGVVHSKHSCRSQRHHQLHESPEAISRSLRLHSAVIGQAMLSSGPCLECIPLCRQANTPTPSRTLHGALVSGLTLNSTVMQLLEGLMDTPMSHSVPTDRTWATYLVSEPRRRTLTCIYMRRDLSCAREQQAPQVNNMSA